MSSSKLALPLNPVLCFFISCVPFVLLSQSFTHRALHLCQGLINLLSLCFCGEFSGFLVSRLARKPLATSLVSLKKMKLSTAGGEREEEEERISLLDLPDLALDLVLERLSPAGLRSMAGVCVSLRERCVSDHLWEGHLRGKWGRVLGESALQQWRCESAARSRRARRSSSEGKETGLLKFVLGMKPLSWMVSPAMVENSIARTELPEDSIMAWYLALESGKFWFPAQVFNRENGHAGFLLSCYDAHLCYDSSSDTFEARYSPHGRRTIEENIEWERLRVPSLETPPYELHVSDCLNLLRPGDHVEIQWRRNKEFPYGWWYGLVGHLVTCDGNENHCRCQYSETVALEFNQYTPGSRWRRTMVNRKDHCEEGNEVDGFYGGIRKLSDKAEISRWQRFWPSQAQE